MLDDEAKRAFRRRLEDIEAELAEAEEHADLERITKLRDEREALAHELAAAVGLGGRDRKLGSAAERARVNVTRAIRTAISRLADHDPDLGEHLAATVKTGEYSVYQPDLRVPITWKT